MGAIDLAPLSQYLLGQPLLALALLSMALVLVGGLLRHLSPLLGGLVRGVGNIGLFGAFLLTVLQIMRVNHAVDVALPGFGMPGQEISGRETRVPIARDGHFWVNATVNGTPQRFLVDTGATVTAISPDLASETRVREQPMRQPLLLRTANGTVAAQLVTIDEIRIGNVVARDLDAVVANGMEGTSVLGMNFLSRLASWRVEGRTLILVPHNPHAGGG